MLESVNDQYLAAPLPAFSYEVSGLISVDAVVDSLMVLLMRALPGDSVGWNGVEPSTGTARIRGFPDEVYDNPQLPPELLLALTDHPMMVSMARSPADLTPRRLSDLVSRVQLRRTQAYADLLRPVHAEEQLSIPTSLTSLGGSCWTIGRSWSSFTDAELDLAKAIQPLLCAVEALARSAALWPGAALRADNEGREEARMKVGLTAREVEVLALVAQGLTATACGHLLRISAETVRKHLAHAYTKLDQHDRLLAVDRARALGILPPHHWASGLSTMNS